MEDLGTLGGHSSEARAINLTGDIVGMSWSDETHIHAFLYTAGQMHNLGSLIGPSGNSDAYEINDAGVVAGVSAHNGVGGRAFRYENGTMHNLGTLIPGDLGSSHAHAINNAGAIVGFSNIVTPYGSQHRAFVYQNGTMTDLGILNPNVYSGYGSYAYDINNHGVIVGASRINEWDEHAVIIINGQMVDLNDLLMPDSGWLLERASSINDAGQITGWGVNPSGQLRAYLLTPIPEPLHLSVVASVCLLLLVRCRRIPIPTSRVSASLEFVSLPHTRMIGNSRRGSNSER